MEIVRPGREQDGWSKEFECTGTEYNGPTGCGALLRVTKADLFQKHTHDIGGARDETVMMCPCCGAQTVLPEPFVSLPTDKEWAEANPERAAAAKTLRENAPKLRPRQGMRR